MSTPTTNYGFIKAAEGEQYDVDIPNNNLDAIDAELKKQSLTRHFEGVFAPAGPPGNTAWGPGDIMASVDNAKSENYSDWLVKGVQNDSVRLTKPGTYTLQWKIVNNGGASLSIWHSICRNGSNTTEMNNTSEVRSVTTMIPPNDPFFVMCKVTVPPAGEEFCFKFVIGASSLVSHRIKITKDK